VSDISFRFTGPEVAFFLLLIGWPGLVFGAVGGGLLWRRRPVLGAVAGAAIGLTLWVGMRVLFA
jgi:hypothetical protein